MTTETAQASAGLDAHEKQYVKTWAILMVLLGVSVAGPELGHPAVTLITAFGVAVVKAVMVARNFMHINLERKWIGYLVLTMLLFFALFVGGTSPDVMKHEGLNWNNDAAKAAVVRGQEAAAAAGPHGH